MNTEEKLLVWKALTGHFIAIILTIGLLTIVIMAIVGKVQLSDPTTATFVGTATGYIVSQLTRPLSYYFNVPRDARDDTKPTNGKIEIEKEARSADYKTTNRLS